MREQKFTTEIMNSLKSHGFWAYKIPDAPYSRMKDAGMRFAPPKPCDIVACKRGMFYAIETKQIKKWQKFSIDDLTLSQITNLSNIVKAGGAAYILLNIRIKKEGIDTMLIFKWSDRCYKELKAGVSASAIEKICSRGLGVSSRICPETKKKIYDLGGIL